MLQGLPFAFADYLYPGGPVLVRRAAFLEVRGLATEQRCFGPHGLCDSGLEADLSLRLWAAGWQVGVLRTGGHHTLSLCGTVAEHKDFIGQSSLDSGLMSAAEKEAAKATDTLSRGMRVDKPSCSKVPYTTTRSVPSSFKEKVGKCPKGPP